MSSGFPGPSLAFATVRSRHRHASASVIGYLRRRAQTRKREKHNHAKKLHYCRKRRKILGLPQDMPQENAVGATFFPRHLPDSGVIHRLTLWHGPVVQPLGSAEPLEGPTPKRHKSTLPASRLLPTAKGATPRPQPPDRPACEAAPKPLAPFAGLPGCLKSKPSAATLETRPNRSEHMAYTPSPTEAEFDVLTAGFGTIQLCL